jgi:hypothetical protein
MKVKRPMNLRNWLRTLLSFALALPVAYCVLAWVRWLVSSMGDAAGARFVDYIGTACLAAWAVSLVGLVILLGVAELIDEPPREDTEE